MMGYASRESSQRNVEILSLFNAHTLLCLYDSHLSMSTVIAAERALKSAGHLSSTLSFPSEYLGRVVKIHVFVPVATAVKPWALLLFNDGQDASALKLEKSLARLPQTNDRKPVLAVAIEAGKRLEEYGVAGHLDYKNRGGKAANYHRFVLDELLPWLRGKFPISQQPADCACAGLSLGGLSAFDLVWNHPDVFGKVGVLSGSFWWRSRDLNDGYTDADRIAHQLVRMGSGKSGLKFWFQVGTDDETCDRNNNGVIDAIDDTMDLITELILKGYTINQDIKYVEVKGGRHDTQTWAKALPDFLQWAFKNE